MGIYNDETPVGFMMLGYENIEDGKIKGVSGFAYNLWRFMIDEKYQGKGYGKRAMELALDYIKTFPEGPAEYAFLSYEPENTSAAQLYKSFGFTETGDIDENELVAIRKIAA